MVGTLSTVAGEELRRWAVLVAVPVALWGELLAVRRDGGEVGQWPWPWEVLGWVEHTTWQTYAALALAALPAFYKLATPSRPPEPSEPEADAGADVGPGASR